LNKSLLRRGLELDTYEQSLDHVDRAVLDGETDGFVKVHVRRGTDQIVGATIVAAHAGEMISELGLAMAGKLGLRTIAKTIHPYPTQAEAIKRNTNIEFVLTPATGWVVSVFQYSGPSV
jgi:pyruvate/2-oxoglutarate dehydrogenase complex dihydrolipoamide dehydrogenase (E3) component